MTRRQGSPSKISKCDAFFPGSSLGVRHGASAESSLLTAFLPPAQAKLGPEVTKLGQANAFKRKWISKQGDTFAQSVRDFSLLCSTTSCLANRHLSSTARSPLMFKTPHEPT